MLSVFLNNFLKNRRRLRSLDEAQPKIQTEKIFETKRRFAGIMQEDAQNAEKEAEQNMVSWPSPIAGIIY